MKELLYRLGLFLRLLVRAFLALFTQTTTEGMGVLTQGNLSPLGQYVLKLSCDQATRNLWITNRALAIQQSGLGQDDQNTLSTGTAASVAATIVAQSGGQGQTLWICVWIR